MKTVDNSKLVSIFTNMDFTTGSDPGDENPEGQPGEQDYNEPVRLVLHEGMVFPLKADSDNS
jgi:hypothetical protein